MKKIIIYILCVCLMFTFIFSKSVFAKNNKNETVENSSIEKEITAKAAVLMEPESKTILVNKNGDEKLCPASITKIMTLLHICCILRIQLLSDENNVFSICTADVAIIGLSQVSVNSRYLSSSSSVSCRTLQ